LIVVSCIITVTATATTWDPRCSRMLPRH